MIDFDRHIRSGIDNATTADGERAEIERILGELDNAIRRCTSGKGKLFVGKFHNADEDEAMRLASVPLRLVIQSTEDEREGRVIAGWEPGSNGGYAAHLVYEFQSLYCGDGDELLEELANLLETARVGRAIQYFANR
ncbi:hypothetical protein ACQ86G_04925 [Roseateles chitinivorans]|uniref:hypothetical protein n=1 Tax=Roseateles chitinivorans TaxID=2917965 RepID=UPI003D666319